MGLIGPRQRSGGDEGVREVEGMEKENKGKKKSTGAENCMLNGTVSRQRKCNQYVVSSLIY